MALLTASMASEENAGGEAGVAVICVPPCRRVSLVMNPAHARKFFGYVMRIIKPMRKHETEKLPIVLNVTDDDPPSSPLPSVPCCCTPPSPCSS